MTFEKYWDGKGKTYNGKLDIKQCWCSVRDCPLHNLVMPRDSTARAAFGTSGCQDFCARGELGMFCKIREIDEQTRKEIGGE